MLGIGYPRQYIEGVRCILVIQHDKLAMNDSDPQEKRFVDNVDTQTWTIYLGIGNKRYRVNLDTMSVDAIWVKQQVVDAGF